MSSNETSPMHTVWLRVGRGLRSVARFFLSTLGVRFLLALISAFALWWFVVGPNPDGSSAGSTIGNYRTVPVVIKRTGNPADGYAVTGVQIAPPTITIQGSAPVLSDVNYVSTEPVDISGAKTTITQVIPLDLPPGVSSTTFSAVTVSIYIAPVVGQVSANVPVTVKNLGANLTTSATPLVVKVTLKGPLSRLNKLDIEPVVDVSGLGPGQYSLPVQVSAPPDVTVVVEPVDVTITLTALK